jgi:hypothetical protein
LQPDEAKRLKSLENENRRLKQLVADLTLGNAMLKDVVGLTLAPNADRSERASGGLRVRNDLMLGAEFSRGQVPERTVPPVLLERLRQERGAPERKMLRLGHTAIVR